MSIEGLQAILEKKEVVPTFGADDLIHRPAQVEADYLYHVRTYLPINRAGEAAEGQLSVEDFEKRLIKQVKEARVPRGYITAGYGYGKTTTALYLWQRAQEANIVIVPPFSMGQLPDLLHATYGWLRYKLGSSRPTFTEQLDALYHATIDRSLERIGGERGLTLEQMQGLLGEGVLNLEIQPVHYIEFFEKATQIAVEAGFSGLVVMPDEIQQYFRPKMKEGGDPIAPFFQIIQLLNTRAASGNVHFGFVMIITLEELAQIRDTFRRNDLLHRMKDLQIDLTSLYDAQFAPNLWELMAQRFEFTAEKDRITDQETLLALGQITARKDISDGPRTIINVFRRMVQRFIDQQGRVTAYTPIDLLTDFLDEQAIPFAGNDKIRTVTRRALSSDLIRVDFDRYAPAIKLAAAFPTDGVPFEIQRKYKQEQALAELMQKAIGEIVRSGSIRDGAIALVGLDLAQIPTQWLPTTVREFRLGYNELAAITQERAEAAFIALLRERVFNKWKLVDQWERSYVANRSLIFEGAFDSQKTKFPRRRVHVRILWEDEAVKDADTDVDVYVEYCLSLYQHLAPEARRHECGHLEHHENFTARFYLNLLHSDSETISAGIQERLKDVWSPYDLSPLVLSNIYQLIEEKRAQDQIPRREDALIKDGFQPEVLDTLMRDLFNETVGKEVDAAGAVITELAVGYLLEERYPDYHPLITVQNWQNLLQKYTNALKLLELPGQRQGDLDVEGTKEVIAQSLNMSHTGLDSFQKAFPDILKTIKEFKGASAGAVRFTLHPLERDIWNEIKNSDKKETQTKAGKTVEVRRVNVASIMREAKKLGYIEEEAKALVDLLQTRGFAEEHQGWLVEVHSATPDLEEIRQYLHNLEREINLLADGFSESKQIEEWRQNIEALRQRLTEQIRQKTPDPNALIRLGTTIRARQKDIATFAHDQQNTLLQRMTALQRVRSLPGHSIEVLNKPFHEDVEFVDQVNRLRVELLRESERVNAEIDKHRANLNEAQALLNRPSLAYDELARQSRSMSEYAKLLERTQHLADTFDKRYQQFGKWADMVRQAAVLLAELNRMNPADADQIRQEFNRLSMDIRGEISSQGNRLDALALHEPYAQRLSALHEQARKLGTKAKEDFAKIQNAYRQVLTEAHLLDNQRWREVVFNPQDPRSAREQVERQVQEIISKGIQRLGVLAKDTRQTLVSVRNNLDLLATRDQQRIDTETQTVLAQIEQAINALPQLEEDARTPSIIHDVFNTFETFIESVVHIGNEILSYRQTVDELKRSVGVIAPTEHEKQLLVVLNRSAESADLVELMSQFTGDVNQFWSALRGLYEKDRIRIAIQAKDV